jgi:hypothetical protein
MFGTEILFCLFRQKNMNCPEWGTLEVSTMSLFGMSITGLKRKFYAVELTFQTIEEEKLNYFRLKATKGLRIPNCKIFF